ncbi:MAG: hypothetical protein ACREDR_48490, partial [Blastocatellia bacterium]
PVMTGVGTTIAIDLSPPISVLLQLQALSLSFSDGATMQTIDSTSGAVTSSTSATESWTSQTYPIQVGIRYTPIVSQFESYGFFMFGAAVSHIRWDYVTTSTTDASTYPPGATFEQTKVSPTFTIGAGFELLFDQFHKQQLLRGVMLEVHYRWAHGSYNIFQPSAAGSFTPVPQWNDSYDINFDGIEVLLGVNFELSH